MTSVAVLFARADSIYKTMPECDVYDIERDARSFPGGLPVVAHPPCRGWGRLRQWSHATADELDLGPWAIQQVRQWGGVLEHPERSRLFIKERLPHPGEFPDEWGGWTLEVDQYHWGHRAQKRTWLYIVGVRHWTMPGIPMRPGKATHCIRPTKAYPRLPSVTKREREATPPAFARWLVDLAQCCYMREAA